VVRINIFLQEEEEKNTRGKKAKKFCLFFQKKWNKRFKIAIPIMYSRNVTTSQLVTIVLLCEKNL
jgi:hypothetical protein